jgi:glucose-6-phosphate isomerase
MGANRRAGTIRQNSANLGRYHAAVDRAPEGIREDRVIERVWEHDHTLWKPEPDEISNRLGWLRTPEEMSPASPEIEALVEAVRADGYTHALLLDVDGSSLAPEVFRRTFGVQEGYLGLAVLDSTDPGAVLDHAESLGLSRTLFIVSTKSGVTVETISYFKYFYSRVAEAFGEEEAGAHFVAITDPGSALEETATRHGFRATFLNDPNIGGRYSALSHFGLVPAALIGADVAKLDGLLS